MKEFNEMTVAIKLKSNEFQFLCETMNRIQKCNENNIDVLQLEIGEQIALYEVLKKIADSGRRKAEKLESIGSEFKNSMDFSK